jgi:1,4-alpha-glucan branching enzyme
MDKIVAPRAVDRTDQELANGVVAADPLRGRSVPDFDLYLFNMGEHRRAHRLLGPHLVDGGVRFAVWAPNARRAAVAGSFIGWNVDVHDMERRGSTGVWERFVPDLGHGFSYKFAVEKPSGRWEFRVDPFARWLQDDANRTPIFGETHYEFNFPRLTLPDKFGGPLNIYEGHPLSWPFKDGRPLSYLELIDELVPYVQ